MENKYLLDTNVVVYYSDDLFDTDNLVIDEIFEYSFNISIISKIEFLGWAGFRVDTEQYTAAIEFVNSANIFHLDEEIAEETIQIRQKHKIKTPDAIIAATARVYNLGLLTRNVEDFKDLDLEVTNPLD